MAVWLCAPSAWAATPAAPSMLYSVVTGSTSVVLVWRDNSTDETDFVVAYTINGANPGTFSLGPNPGAATGTVNYTLNTLSASTPYTFAIRSVKGSEVSAYTNTVSVNIGSMNPPASLMAVPQTDGAFTLLWADNAYSEAGYALEYRALPSGTWTDFGYVGANQAACWIGRQPWMAPSTGYEFRVRGFQGSANSPSNYTSYSNSVSVAVPALTAPSNLTVTACDETSVVYSIQGTTCNNSGYELEVSRAGANSFALLYTIGDTSASPYLTTGTASKVLPPGTSFDFRARAFYQDASGHRIYSPYTGIASAATPFYPPTNLTATASATSPYQISFAWTDNSSVEGGYQLEYRKLGGTFAWRTTTSANATSISNLPDFEPGTTYEFRIRAIAYLTDGTIIGSAYYPASGGIAATTRNGFSSKPYAPITLGVPFSYQLTTQSQSPRTGWTVGALPAGLSFNNTTGLITGTVNNAGVYTVPLTANFSNGTSHAQTLTLRVIARPAPPQIVLPIGAQTLTQSGSATLHLSSYFADPDTESALRMVTSKGNLDLILYANSTPQTVANFLSYANRTSESYNYTLFHRAPAGFVLQGGGFYFCNSTTLAHITPASPVVNEPGISNTFGTLAMAKLADQPDSATSEFFVNLNDNSANLDAQDGGFTVFGRLTAPTISATLAPLASITTYTRYIPVYDFATQTTNTTTFSDLPIDGDGIPCIVSVEPLPVLTYSITASPNSAIATAALSGSSLLINAVGSGTTSITVSATDVDGNTTPQTFAVTVQQTVAEWAAGQGLTGSQAAPGARRPDGLTNLHAFAFMADPAHGVPAHLPTVAVKASDTTPRAKITFPVRKFASGLTYVVEASNTLGSNDWTTLWTSTDGLNASAVSALVDQGASTLVTIADTQPVSGSSRRFLRVKLIGP